MGSTTHVRTWWKFIRKTSEKNGWKFIRDMDLVEVGRGSHYSKGWPKTEGVDGFWFGLYLFRKQVKEFSVFILSIVLSALCIYVFVSLANFSIGDVGEENKIVLKISKIAPFHCFHKIFSFAPYFTK